MERGIPVGGIDFSKSLQQLEAGYEYYPGDLLDVILMISAGIWEAHPRWHREVLAIAIAARARCDEINAQAKIDWRVSPVLPDATAIIDRFLARYVDGR